MSGPLRGDPRPDEVEFGEQAYLSLADEFDPMGTDLDAPPLEFDPDEWDAEYVAAARAYAQRYGIPLPWEVRSVDVALHYVERARYNEREDARIERLLADVYPEWEHAR